MPNTNLKLDPTIIVKRTALPKILTNYHIPQQFWQVCNCTKGWSTSNVAGGGGWSAPKGTFLGAAFNPMILEQQLCKLNAAIIYI